MSVTALKNAFVVSGSQKINVSDMFSISAGSSNPAYMVLSGLDRNEYTKSSTGATGTLSGNGITAKFAASGGDFRTVGIVFTYNAATGRYYSSTYGYLDQLTYTASASPNDLTNLSLFGTSSLSYAQTYAAAPTTMESAPSVFTYYGSASIATQPSFSGTVPVQATQGLICSVAASFVGSVWNHNGCWVLASTIAAEAGASLPVGSTSYNATGNGPWGFVFDGTKGQTGDWKSMVTAGDIILIGNAQTGLGHITTCVSGTGSTAMLIDNANFGTNSANDGNPADLIIMGPHLASGEFGQAATNMTIIYRLDCPVMTVTLPAPSLLSGASMALSSVYTCADPFGKVITQYQVYDTAATDSLTVNGSKISAHDLGSACTVTSLSTTFLVGGNAPCTDLLQVRAYNGTYWGDWKAVSVAVQTPSAPVVVSQTADQTWLQGSKVSLKLATNTFTDPQGLKMTYTAKANGGVLPGWLAFNPATMTFTGTVPVGMQKLSLSVTATDSSGMSATENFQATIPSAAPTLVKQTVAQTWTEGTRISFALPAGTFTDPDGQTLSYTATLANGQWLPSWLSLNSASGEFSGTVGYTSGPMSIKVVATDPGGLAATEAFTATLVAPAPVLRNQTANQSWTAGRALSFSLAADTFTYVPGQTLKYAASGLPVGLTIDAATGKISGTAPFALGTATIKITATQTSGLTASETFKAAITASAPTLAAQTGDQTWTANQAVSFALPGGTFFDPQGQKLTYAAAGAPTGITFNAATQTFSGTAPVGLASYTIKVTATDQSGLAVAELFRVGITASAPTVANRTVNQVWTANKSPGFTLPVETFADPQGEKLTYTATMADGSALVNGITFNAVTGAFGGLAPVTTGDLSFKVKATNASGLSASETFKATVTAASPTLAIQAADQTWTANKGVAFALPAKSFVDPQGETMTYAATLADGSALPGWLIFNKTSAAFTGTAPTALQSLALKVTATDASGLSTSETFKAGITAAAPTLARQTTTQTWVAGKAISFAVPANTFTDPQGEKLTYTAKASDGSALPNGLAFNGATDVFSGIAPITPQTLGLTITATNASGLSVSETFSAVVQPSAPMLVKQTANQLWTAGQALNFLMPANTFADPQNAALALTAFQTSGADQTSWLHFDSSLGDFIGTVPTGLTGTIGVKIVATDIYGLSSSETFGVTFAAPGAHIAAAAPPKATELLAFHS